MGVFKKRFNHPISLSLNKEATMVEFRRGEKDNNVWKFRWRRDLFEWE